MLERRRGRIRHRVKRGAECCAFRPLQMVAEEAAEGRVGKRRPSTAAATAAAESARAQLAANAAARWDRQPPTFERSAWDEVSAAASPLAPPSQHLRAACALRPWSRPLRSRPVRCKRPGLH